MKGFILIFSILTCLTSCLTEEQQREILAADSAVNSPTGVDTFIVGKKSELTITPEGESLLVANDTALENIRIAISGTPTNEEEVITNTTIVKNPDVAPSFPGGGGAMDKFVAKNLLYPRPAFKNNVEGTVIVRFVVETDGKLTGIVVQKSLGFGCDEAAINVIKSMPIWSPGKKAGANVRCSVVLPLSFDLKDDDDQ